MKPDTRPAATFNEHWNHCEVCWLWALTFEGMVGLTSPACRLGAELIDHENPAQGAKDWLARIEGTVSP